MKNPSFLVLPTVIAIVLSLAACNDASSPAGGDTAPKAAATSVSIEAIAAEAKGFTVGSTMSVRTVYVFFDSQCPHCAVLWESAKPLKSQAKFIWIEIDHQRAIRWDDFAHAREGFLFESEGELPYLAVDPQADLRLVLDEHGILADRCDDGIMRFSHRQFGKWLGR